MTLPLVISHANCPDGAGAALAAFLLLGEDAEYRFASYGEPAPVDADLEGRAVYVIDFSYPRAEMVRMLAAASRLVVLDHHKTAQAALEGFPGATFDMEQSGAVLAYRHFFPDSQVPTLFRYLQDRDLWRWELPGSREVSASLEALGFRRNFRAGLPYVTGWQDWYPALVAEGTGIRRYIATTAAAIADDAEQRGLLGTPCAAVGSSILQSEVGEELIRRGNPLAAIYSVNADGTLTVSLRSALGLDCSAIAQRFGGGGHAQAAGFRIPALPWIQS